MTDADNPLLQPSGLPYGLPDFAAIRDEHVIPAFRTAFDDHRAEIAAIVANPEEPDFANTIEALERSGRMLDRVASYFFNVAGTDATDERLAIEATIAPELAAHMDAIRLDAGLWDRVSRVPEPEGEDREEARRLLARHRRDFLRAGADLDEAGKRRLTEINARLSELGTAFGENLLADTRARAVHVTDEAELAGLSAGDRASLRRGAEAAGLDGWLIPLDLPSVQPILADLEDAGLRARVYSASVARGTGEGRDNRGLIPEIVRLRAERARLLGHDTHADYVIADETAGSAKAARDLIAELAPAAAANAEGEAKILADLAGEPVGAADWAYWAERRRAEEFAVDGEELRKYFELETVLRDGVFGAAEMLYGIRVVPRDDLRGYADGVRVWEVLEGETGEGIGLLLTDLFARPVKRGGAWMSSFVNQSRLLGERTVAVNVLNIAEPAEGERALLTMDEVTTLFHEFGHGLHGLLSDVEYPRFSGTNVPRDFVEFPSQINENWALHPDVLARYARHVDTGEPIPAELVESVRRTRTAGEGFATTEYLAAAALDLAWHSLTPEEAEAVDDVEAFEARALERAGLDVDGVAPRYRSAFFNHVFAGGYSAGYYSYLWAEVLDADGFGRFEEAGGADRATGMLFRELILSKGGSVDFGEAYRAFRGRDRDVAPLLHRRGLAGAAG
ncbi:M3 family metallopeptidase [Corynebacterium sp. 335C]